MDLYRKCLQSVGAESDAPEEVFYLHGLAFCVMFTFVFLFTSSPIWLSQTLEERKAISEQVNKYHKECDAKEAAKTWYKHNAN